MDVQGVPSQSNLAIPPNDEITNFDQLCENVTGKLNLENWMVLPSQRTLHIFCLNKKLNGNLSIRNTIFIDVNLVVKVFGESDDEKLFSLKLCSWPQLQTLIEQCGVLVKREVNLEFISVVEKATNHEVVEDQKEDTLAFKFGGRITKTEVSDIHQPSVELIETAIPIHEAPLACYSGNDNQTANRLLSNSNESVRLTQICSICNAIYAIDEIDQHMRQHFNGESYPCNVCGRECQSLIALQKHVKSNHTLRGEFLCDMCDGGREFETKESLKEHIKESHCSAPMMEQHGRKSSGKNKWKTCPFCDKSYVCLNRHIQDRHFNVRNHVCDICGSAYKQWTSLKEHIEAKHAPHEQLFCDICHGKAFRSKTSLKRHFAQMHGNRIVKSGKRRQTKGKAFYECNVCDEKLPSYYTLKSHVARRHSDGNNFHCRTCDKTFGLRSQLDTHEKLHSGKVHLCSVCGQSFRHANYLRKHLKQHAEIKKLRCTMCEKEYVQRVGLRLHMEKVHGIVLGITQRTADGR